MAVVRGRVPWCLLSGMTWLLCPHLQGCPHSHPRSLGSPAGHCPHPAVSGALIRGVYTMAALPGTDFVSTHADEFRSSSSVLMSGSIFWRPVLPPVCRHEVVYLPHRPTGMLWCFRSKPCCVLAATAGCPVGRSESPRMMHPHLPGVLESALRTLSFPFAHKRHLLVLSSKCFLVCFPCHISKPDETFVKQKWEIRIRFVFLGNSSSRPVSSGAMVLPGSLATCPGHGFTTEHNSYFFHQRPGLCHA